jgi:hypothetical protein
MSAMTYQRGSVQDLENRIELRRLKLERALERCDYDEANIASAQLDYCREELRLMQEVQP